MGPGGQEFARGAVWSHYHAGLMQILAPLLSPVSSAVASLTTCLAADDQAQGGGMDMLLMIGIVFLIFWFLVIRPQGKERKQREAAVQALKKNDKVVTNAGIHGTVVGIEDDAVLLRVDDKNNVRMKFSRAAIWQVEPPAGSKKSDDGKKKAEAAAK